MWRPPGNWVLETRFISRQLETQFICDVVGGWSTWKPPGNLVSKTWFQASVTHPLILTLTPLSHLLHPHTDTLSRSRLSHSHASLTHPLHSHSVLSSMIFLLCDFFMWVCGFWSKTLIRTCFVCYSIWFPRKCEENFLFCAEIVVFEKI